MQNNSLHHLFAQGMERETLELAACLRDVFHSPILRLQLF